MRSSKLAILGGLGALSFGAMKVSVSFNSQELAELLELATQYFLLIAYLVLLYLYFVLKEEHRDCQIQYAAVSKELSDLKDRLINLEKHAS